MSATVSKRADEDSLTIARAGKVLFPESGITKGDLADYYRRISATILPHLHARPLVLQRFPDGLAGEGFFQKDVPDYFPDWIPTVELKKEGGRVRHALCEDEATLIYLAGQACITLHVWLSSDGEWDRPDRLAFDLDPPGSDFTPVAETARALRELLRSVGLEAFVMATGSRGLHVVAPLDRSADFDAVRAFAHDAAGLLARRRPETLTTEARKNKRGSRVYLDTMRNGYAQTTVAPYAVRAIEGAPVATPLEWDEVSPRLDPRRFTIRNMLRRLAQRKDPWERIASQAQPLAAARRRLDEIVSAG